MNDEGNIPSDLDSPMDTTIGGPAGTAGMFGCRYCGEVFPSLRELEMHVNVKHKGKGSHNKAAVHDTSFEDPLR